MRAIIFVLLALAFAADVKYAGTTEGSGLTYNPPAWDSTTGACSAPTTVTTSYVAFTFDNFGEKAYHVIAHAQKEFFGAGYVVAVYSNFVAATPCANLVTKFLSQSSAKPSLSDFAVLPNGTYTVVVSTLNTVVGVFAVNFIEVTTYGNTMNSAWTWNVPSSSTTACSSGSTTTRVSFYTFKAPATGYYDVVVILHNTTYYNYQIRMVAYNSTFPLSTMLSNTTFDPCTAAPQYYIGVGYQDMASSKGKEGFMTLNVVANQTYTVAFSHSRQDTWADYMVRLRPTEVHNLPANPKDFAAPYLSSTPDSCTAGSLKNWDTVIFKAEYPVYVMDQGYADTIPYQDLDGSLYEGTNIAAPPVSCNDATAGIKFVMAGDIGDITTLYKAGMKVGSNYTMVVTPHSSCNGPYRLSILTGKKIGVVPGVPETITAKPTALVYNCTTIVVKWTTPASLPALSDYKIEYQKKGPKDTAFGSWTVATPSWTTQKVAGQYTHYQIDRETTYHYRVTAYNTEYGYADAPSPTTDDQTTFAGVGRVTFSILLFVVLGLLLL